MISMFNEFFHNSLFDIAPILHGICVLSSDRLVRVVLSVTSQSIQAEYDLSE